MKIGKYLSLIILTLIALGFSTADAQQNLAQQVYAIFQQNCLNCHGPHGAFTEQLVIESAPGLIATGAVVPGNPLGSNLYTRLLETDSTKRMPLGQPRLPPTTILTIRNWITAGAPSWDVQHDVNFITTDTMLSVIQNHLNTLPPFDRTFARYFTMTHLYNAGEGLEALSAYQVALSKLVNSLSWGFEIHNPEPIDAAETIFYIDLRDYEWDVRGDAWTQIEREYPYAIEFDATTQAGLLEKLTNLRQEMDCQVPFVHVDWFLATASLPPLYHDILDLPATDRELERELNVDVARNIQTAPGNRVWRAGFNNSGVSNNNRVVERHRSRYGAYWKSYDFAGSVGAQNILTHPLSFRHDGGEVVFNLPNGLQGYYISDASGNRIDVAPTDIVSNPAASDPAVRNGLSCIGCHTEGMKEFEDNVRSVIEQTANPAFNKAQALRLYVEKEEMDRLLSEDIERYKDALEATGGVFGGIEPVFRFYEAFQKPLKASRAAAAVGWETEAFLQQISDKSSLQNLGLAGLLRGGNVQRDAWRSNFDAVVSALYRDTSGPTPPEPPRPVPVGGVYIPDPNLRTVIEGILGKAAGSTITTEDMERLTRIDAEESEISDLTGLEHAIRLERIEFQHNSISDLSPVTGLVRMRNIKLRGNKITDVSPLAELKNVDWLGLEENAIADLSPLVELVKLNGIGIEGNPVTDISPLAEMKSLEGVRAWNTAISDFSALSKLPRFRWIEFSGNSSISKLPSLKGLKTLRRLEINHTTISDISDLSELTQLKELTLHDNLIKDISPLSGLGNLTYLNLSHNQISDVSPLAGLNRLERLNLRNNAISDFSPLRGLAEKIVIEVSENPGTGKFLQGGPKIRGPWLWVQFPGLTSDDFRRDLLARASGGDVTELGIATNGAIEGQTVGDSVWTSGKIQAEGWNNIGQMLGASGDASKTFYGSITLDSPREQKTKMFVGSSDWHKVWLNGELVTEKLNWNTSHDYQEFFPVTLKHGKNVLLVAVWKWDGWVSGYFGFAPDAEYTVLPPGASFSFSTNTTQFGVGDTFTLHLRAENVSNLAGWQTNIAFDPNVLKADRVNEGSFLKQNGGQVRFQKGEINNTTGRINGLSAVRFSEGGVSGAGTLLSATFTAKADGETRVLLRNFRAGSSEGKTILATLSEIIILVGDRRTSRPPWDVNEDGQVNVIDLVLVANALATGLHANPRADVNGDGSVNVLDLITITRHLDSGAAPAVLSNVALPPGLTLEMVENALDVLRVTDDGSLTFRRTIANLEQLLAFFVPEETTLLHNYPNPFNPETWIPYQLAEASDVTLHIYAANGILVRTLDLGHQPAGIYRYRSRAAYWDGSNEVGEPVASGIYFYTLTAGDFTATRKMLIRK